MDKQEMMFEEFICSPAYDEKVDRYVAKGRWEKLLALFAKFCFACGWEAHKLSTEAKA
jgi:hypothetical protein